ncbi:MAG: zinc ribbon domain-containing protein [Lachnospiraceae bacterium]|nr:zinc ribbon domain-containing protein [Lachnospiraceae bacterium]
MSDDFFGDLGKSLSRSAQKAANKTGTFFESTKMSAQISGEQKEVEKLYADIGELVYEKTLQGEMPEDPELAELIHAVREHRVKILKMKRELAGVKGMQICPNCQEEMAPDAAFCPKCGARIELKQAVGGMEKKQLTAEAEEENLTEEKPTETDSDEKLREESLVHEIIVEDPIELQDDSEEN